MYCFNYKIKDEDINYGGHVGNERALLFFQMARINFFESMGLTELDLGEGAGVIQKNGFIEYNRQLFLNDIISINITDIEFSKSSFNIKYEIYNEENFKVINGSTLLVCYDYKANKVRKIPENFKMKATMIIQGDK
ncbi:thioesterase family protein [Fusobacterium hominis]|jgi:acyl-CoA thioester hydrolase|uniref:Acyl-CoA thioesterase n=1 Tax=Fusobacterium hominis TaxID=2764326 RepID=A0A7G9GZD4_9FUSO|nr:thioesterase family protein [Fusobacterium hominis]QNM16166.1 acyl-CoA thioesterase [Fusobacterium hominis]